MNPNDNKKIVSQDLDDRKIIVLKDGKVQVTENVKTVYEQDYRDFLSDIRNMQKYKEEVSETLKPDFKKKQQERIGEVDKQLKELKPYLVKSEKAFLKNEEVKRLKSLAEGVKRELKKDVEEQNLDYISAIWDNISKKDKGVLDYLEKSEVDELKRLKLKKVNSKRR